MILSILKFFCIAAIAPVVMVTLFTAFIQMDASLINPVNWVKGARFASVIWVTVIILSITNAFTD